MAPELRGATGQSENERRKLPRLPYRSEIHWGAQDLQAAQCVDLTFGGVGFLSTLPPQVGEEVEVAFLDRGVSVRGTVRNYRPTADGYRVGVQFQTEEREVVEVVLGQA